MRAVTVEPESSLHLRRYEPGDRDAVWELHLAALARSGAEAGEEYFADLRDVERLYLEAGGEFLLGFIEGRLVAMGALRRTSHESAEVLRMRVRPGWRRRGFGEAILEALETRAREAGFQALHLETTAQQVAARRLYEKHGFVERSRGERLGYEVVRFEKELGVEAG